MAVVKAKSFPNKLVPYLFLAPAMIFILVVFLYPVLDLIRRSTTAIRQGELQYIGLEAYRLALKDDVFWVSISNNLRLFLAVPILAALSLIFATLIFEQVRGWKVYRSIVFIPYVIAIPVVGIIFSYILQLNGVLNTALRSGGMQFLALDWLGSSRYAIWSLMGVVIWKELGFGIVLFLARLASIQEDLLDAAELDGAGWMQRLRHVILPQTATVLEFYIVINLILMLSWVFSYVLVMTKGGPGTSTWVMEFFIYQKAFRYTQMHIASAGAVFLLALAMVLMIFQARYRRQVESYIE